MIPTQERSGFADGAAIDRLVEGELTGAERRDLLLRLDQDPDGWRRCALAFLEDQALRMALAPASGVASPFAATPRAATLSLPRSPASFVRRVAIAATLLASTFAAGFAASGLTRIEQRVELARPELRIPVPAPAATVPSEIREVGSLELVDGSAGETPPERFPIRSGPGLDDQWLRSQPPTVPDYVRASWERQGYQVRERRKLVSVESGDGRRVSVPVDEVKLDYVGRTPL